MEGKNIDFAIIDEACQKAADIISEAVSELALQLKPTTDRLVELMEAVNEANKPPQGRDAFRGFVEGRDKRKNYRKQIRR